MIYIFIDLGANVGQSIDHWKRYKGKDFVNWECYSFEPYELPWNIKDPNVHLIRKTAWIKDGFINLYLTGGRRKLGSSVCKDKKGNTDKFIISTCIDFAIFLNQFKEDYVVLKMNIEGSEYDLIPHLYETKALLIVDEIYVAWHKDKMINITQEHHDRCVKIAEHIIKYIELPEIQHRHPNMFL